MFSAHNKKDTWSHIWCPDFDLRWNLLENICVAQILNHGYTLDLLTIHDLQKRKLEGIQCPGSFLEGKLLATNMRITIALVVVFLKRIVWICRNMLSIKEKCYTIKVQVWLRNGNTVLCQVCREVMMNVFAVLICLRVSCSWRGCVKISILVSTTLAR